MSWWDKKWYEGNLWSKDWWKRERITPDLSFTSQSNAFNMDWKSLWSSFKEGWNKKWTPDSIDKIIQEKDANLTPQSNAFNSIRADSPAVSTPAVDQSFSSPFDISGLASGINAVNAFGETLGLWKSPQTKIAERNFALQQEQYEYQKELQKQLFAREDNAVQRRAADLQAAGLSKNLAAGSGANAGAVVKTSAPQLTDMPSDLSRAQKMSIALDNLQSALSLEHLDLQNQLLNEQVKGERIANKVANLDYDWYGKDKVLGYIFDALGSGASLSKARSYRRYVNNL